MSAQSGYLASYDGPSYAGFSSASMKNAASGLNGSLKVRTIVKDTRSTLPKA